MNLAQRQERLATLNDLGEILNADPDFDSAIASVLERLVRLLGLASGWVFLSNTTQGDSHRGSFQLAASSGLPPALSAQNRAPLCHGSCECQGLFRKGRLDRGVNMVTCSRLANARGDRGGLELHASVPLLGSGGPVGILNIAAAGNDRFDSDSLTFLAAVGKQLGVAFERSRLQAQRTREASYTAVLEERQRLAQRIHDSLAQLLFAAELNLQAASDQAADDAGEVPEPLKRATETVRLALTEMRGLVEVQRPADLSAGLVPALSRLVARTGSGRVRVHLDTQPLEAFGNGAKVIYYIAQEALANALRHSAANNVWLRLGMDDGVVLEVQDDGVGFDSASDQGGLGLPGMYERAQEANGFLEIDAGPEGTLVRARVPVEEFEWRG